jgi:DNA-binding protein H-NS
MNPTQSSKLSRGGLPSIHYAFRQILTIITGTQTRTSANFFPLRSPNRVASSHLNGFSLFPQGQERNHLGGESPPHYSSRGADAEMTDFDHSYCLDDTGTLRSTRPGEDLRRHPSQRRKEINQLRSRSSKRLKEALKLAKTEVQKEREARQAAESTVHELLEWIDSLQTSLKMSNLRFEEPIPENLHSANGRSTSEAPQLFAPPPPPPSPLPRRRFSLEKCLQPSTPTRFSCNSTRCTSTCPVFPGHQRSEASGSLRQLVRKISDKCLRKTYTERTDSVTHLPSQKELEEDPKEVAQVEKRHRIGKEVRHSWG